MTTIDTRSPGATVESEIEALHAHVIGLRGDGGAAGIGALRGKDGRCGIAFLVRVLKEARRHNACPIDDERARVRNAVRTRARLLLFVQDAEAPDDCRPRSEIRGKVMPRESANFLSVSGES